jgi:hypothetical protein
MKNQVSFVVAAVALVAFATVARAQRKAEDEARAQFDAGVELFDSGMYEKAAIAFSRAYELKPSFKILFNMGQVENELGHFAAALNAYTRYLAEGGEQIDAARRAQVRTEIAWLNALVGSVVVGTDTSGAIVFVDGRRVGETPLNGPLFVDLGEHEIRISRGTDEMYREIVTVAGGQRVTVSADNAHAVAAIDGTQPSGPPPRNEPKRIWTWVAVGVGGVSAIAAAVTGGLAISGATDVKDKCDGKDCPLSVKDKARTVEALGNATNALVVVATVGIAAGVALWFLEPKWNRDERTAQVTPIAVPTANGGAIAVAGRF